MVEILMIFLYFEILFQWGQKLIVYKLPDLAIPLPKDLKSKVVSWLFYSYRTYRKSPAGDQF